MLPTNFYSPEENLDYIQQAYQCYNEIQEINHNLYYSTANDEEVAPKGLNIDNFFNVDKAETITQFNGTDTEASINFKNKFGYEYSYELWLWPDIAEEDSSFYGIIENADYRVQDKEEQKNSLHLLPPNFTLGIKQGNLYFCKGNRDTRFKNTDNNSKNHLGAFHLSTRHWSHIAFTMDSCSLNFFLNGNLVHTQPHSHPQLFPKQYSSLKIGCASFDDRPYFFNGFIENVSVWNLALTTEQVRARMYSYAMPLDNGLLARYNVKEIGSISLHSLQTLSRHELIQKSHQLVSSINQISDSSFQLNLSVNAIVKLQDYASALEHIHSLFLEFQKNHTNQSKLAQAGIDIEPGTKNMEELIEKVAQAEECHQLQIQQRELHIDFLYNKMEEVALANKGLVEHIQELEKQNQILAEKNKELSTPKKLPFVALFNKDVMTEIESSRSNGSQSSEEITVLKNQLNTANSTIQALRTTINFLQKSLTSFEEKKKVNRSSSCNKKKSTTTNYPNKY